jgi:hypothetical protein
MVPSEKLAQALLPFSVNESVLMAIVVFDQGYFTLLTT